MVQLFQAVVKCDYRIAGFFCGGKLTGILWFFVYLQKFSPTEILTQTTRNSPWCQHLRMWRVSCGHVSTNHFFCHHYIIAYNDRLHSIALQIAHDQLSFLLYTFLTCLILAMSRSHAASGCGKLYWYNSQYFFHKNLFPGNLQNFSSMKEACYTVFVCVKCGNISQPIVSRVPFCGHWWWQELIQCSAN